VEVAISTTTFEVHPTRIWLVIDGGNLLMPDHAKSSVESSVEETLSWCSFQSGNRELPLVDIQFHDSNSKRPPRDVTTIPWLLLPSAYLQAVRQASGISVSRIPVTPELLRNEGIDR
jgi:CO/xanthine dehydrogenase Mo-binding subunit